MSRINLFLFQWVGFGIALLSAVGPYVYEIAFWKNSSVDTSGSRILLIALWGIMLGYSFTEWLTLRKAQAVTLERSPS